MDIKFIVQQHVESVKKGWREEVFSTLCERTARYTYVCMCKDNPDEYFELVKVEHSETLLEHTNKEES